MEPFRNPKGTLRGILKVSLTVTGNPYVSSLAGNPPSPRVPQRDPRDLSKGSLRRFMKGSFNATLNPLNP